MGDLNEKHHSVGVARLSFLIYQAQEFEVFCAQSISQGVL